MLTKKTLVAEGQIKTLAKSLIAEPRLDDYRKLHWHIRKSEQPLILGDVGCLFEVRNAKRFKSLSDKDDVIVAAYLPISSDTIVVGTGGSAMSLDFIEMPTFTTPLELQVDYLFNVTKRTKLQSSLSTKEIN